MVEVAENNGIVVVSVNEKEIFMTREQAEELYNKLDAELYDETRNEVEEKLIRSQLEEDLLRESVYFAESCKYYIPAWEGNKTSGKQPDFCLKHRVVLCGKCIKNCKEQIKQS